MYNLIRSVIEISPCPIMMLNTEFEVIELNTEAISFFSKNLVGEKLYDVFLEKFNKDYFDEFFSNITTDKIKKFNIKNRKDEYHYIFLGTKIEYEKTKIVLVGIRHYKNVSKIRHDLRQPLQNLMNVSDMLDHFGYKKSYTNVLKTEIEKLNKLLSILN